MIAILTLILSAVIFRVINKAHNDEMTRLVNERNELQERLLGRPLNHSGVER